ncbi:MAG: hypothetical protein II891_02880 [Bacteroidales bacterium]|nr:hypothetical protein [Bacteroidales bacterium]
MKKILVLLAAALFAVSASASTPVDPVARTESMTKKLGLNDRQARKVFRLNNRYSDVLGEEIVLGKPIYGGESGPYYDTPGRPHPSGNNGVPGSWSKNPGGAPNTGPAIGVAPASAQSNASDAKAVEKLVKRRTKYEKKLSRILTPEQFATWSEGQAPFTGR